MFGFCDPWSIGRRSKGAVAQKTYSFASLLSCFLLAITSTLIPFLKFHTSRREQLSPFTLVCCYCDSMLLVKCVGSVNQWHNTILGVVFCPPQPLIEQLFSYLERLEHRHLLIIFYWLHLWCNGGTRSELCTSTLKAFVSAFADRLKLQIAQNEKAALKVQEYSKTEVDLQLVTVIWSQWFHPQNRMPSPLNTSKHPAPSTRKHSLTANSTVFHV